MPNSVLRVAAPIAKTPASERLLYPLPANCADQVGPRNNQENATSAQGSHPGKRSRLPVWLSWLERPVMPKFDPTVNLGHVLMILTLFLTMAGGYAVVSSTLGVHENRLNALEEGAKLQRLQNSDNYNALNKMGQDLAVIRDRMERPK